MSQQRRTLNSYFIEPFKQIRFGLYVGVVSVFFAILMAMVFVVSFSEQYKQVEEFFEVADSVALLTNSVFIKNAIYAGIIIFLYLVTMTLIVVRRTHRMYGPIVSILRFVEELKAENFHVRLKIRKKDDFQNVVDSLNTLAQKLHMKYGTSSTIGSMDNLKKRIDLNEVGLVNVNSPEE